MLTRLLLSRLLTDQSAAATAALVESLMEKRHSYYLDDFKISYHMETDGSSVMVTNTMCADVHLAPDCSNYLFVQTIESDAAAELLSFTLDGDRVEPVLELSGRRSAQGEQLTVSVNLKDYLKPGQHTIRLERTYVTVQDMHAEPFISDTISRFIKGAVIETEISPGYRVRLIANGMEKCNPKPVPGGGRKVRWELAQHNVLLLPGQGYTLILIAN